MDKVLQGSAELRPTISPGFSLGRAAGGSLVACLWLWSSAGALAAAAPAASVTAYQRALESFNHEDYARALIFLEQAPANGSPSEQADLLNLRGAIDLRQHRYEQAQTEFARASSTDHNLWAARFNEAEVSFRPGHYAESRRRFAALLDQTSRLFHNGEHRFVQYKMLLAGLCADDEKPALDFIADHRDDDRPPLAWYYLNAALEHRHGRSQKAEEWLAQANASYVASSGQTYAESFDRLGWESAHHDAVASRDPQRPANQVTIAANTVAKAPVSRFPRPTSPEAFAADLAEANTPPATVAATEVMARSGEIPFRDSPAGSSAAPTSPEMPPGTDEALAAFEETVRAGHDAATAPATMARPRKSHASPTPSASPDATPDATTANQGGAATPATGPASSPSSEFTEKYEAAYVKFLEKNYPEVLSLLDEADKIQPDQPQSISLRFKAHYALAYIEYRKQNYPGALAHLDDADRIQKNADSYNLRGLIFSKQHNYDQAEGMFHKAITTDPALWAAKFNYAELPFNRGNYTDARTRFEELFSQTDVAKQPREAELTQYKVFLTLLLEGKVEAASTFMDHLNFSGATPARYFCNAALNFRAGSVDKAKNWIDDAKKEFPPQLVAIFIESFYRLGWMADPNAPAGTAVAEATPAATPAVVTSGTQPTTVATATASPGASPTGTAAAAPTPIVVAAASPTPTPLAVPPAVTLIPHPKVSPTPVVAAMTPTPAPTRALASANGSPAPSASSAPVVIVPMPAASPARTVALSTAAPRPAATIPPVSIHAATPARSVAATRVGTLATVPTPSPTTAQPASVIKQSAPQSRKNDRRLLLVGIVLLQTLYYVIRMFRLLSERNAARARLAERVREPAESSN